MKALRSKFSLNACCNTSCFFTGKAPDVIVGDLTGVTRYGNVGGITALFNRILIDYAGTQVGLVAAICLGPAFRLMGKDYESAVMSSGFCGFMLGTTANAMANMEALVQRFRAAPRAFLIVPMVGAFFIDIINAMVIQGSLALPVFGFRP